MYIDKCNFDLYCVGHKWTVKERTQWRDPNPLSVQSPVLKWSFFGREVHDHLWRGYLDLAVCAFNAENPLRENCFKKIWRVVSRRTRPQPGADFEFDSAPVSDMTVVVLIWRGSNIDILEAIREVRQTAGGAVPQVVIYVPLFKVVRLLSSRRLVRTMEGWREPRILDVPDIRSG
jgi:hypothetical protein